jgi:hypothetical protein
MPESSLVFMFYGQIHDVHCRIYRCCDFCFRLIAMVLLYFFEGTQNQAFLDIPLPKYIYSK